MLILIPYQEGQENTADGWINPAFIVRVSDDDAGCVIDLAHCEDSPIYSSLSAKAVAQLCYEAKHNM